jgi:hypothetical protein
LYQLRVRRSELDGDETPGTEAYDVTFLVVGADTDEGGDHGSGVRDGEGCVVRGARVGWEVWEDEVVIN